MAIDTYTVMHMKHRKQKWKRWLKKDLRPEIRYLMTLKIVYKKMTEVFTDSQKYPEKTYIYWYIAQVHSASIVAGIYRLIDKRGDVVSLYRLLTEVKNNPELVSRCAYTRLPARYPNHTRNYLNKNGLNKEFTQMAGNGKYINRSIVDRDIKQIDNISDRVGKFRHKFIGHHADNQRHYRVMPTFKQAHDCVDELERIFNKYYQLITGTFIINNIDIQGIEDDISSFFKQYQNVNTERGRRAEKDKMWKGGLKDLR